MNKWVKWVLILLQLGGGFAGLCISIGSLINLECDIFETSIYVIFSLLYSYGIFCSYLLIESKSRGTQLSLLYQLMQVLSIKSSLFSYLFTSGAMVSVNFRIEGVSVGYKIGSAFEVALHAVDPFIVSVNLIPLFMIMLMLYPKGNKRAGVRVPE